MGQCCEHHPVFDGASPAYRRALLAVIAINAVMFLVEMAAGIGAASQALMADALDFAGDTATYALSLAVIGRPARLRARAALLKGASLALFALIVLGTTLGRVLAGGTPEAVVMSGIGLLALAANVASVLILLRWREGDANVRSVWLCSRNDAIGNAGVIAAGGLVAVTGSAWPDLLFAFVMAGLFLRSSVSIIARANGELAAARGEGDAPSPSAHPV